MENLHSDLANVVVKSLVAEEDDKLVGHILFSKMTFTSSTRNADLSIAGLAPLAVLPEYQKKGIGSELVRKGIDECRLLGNFIIKIYLEYLLIV